LNANTSGADNTATGNEALAANTTGALNTANGFQALTSNTSAYDNTADGGMALSSNTLGNYNTAVGSGSLQTNVNGSYNMAAGASALAENTSGVGNTAVGEEALENNTTGSGNIGVGISGGYHVTTGSNNIEIFDPGQASDNNTIRIGTQGTQTQTFVAGIAGVTVANATEVFVDSSTGQLGTVSSSQRFKEHIQNMGEASEAILALRPVTFRYKPQIDPAGTPQFGLIAEEVEKVAPDLVVRDARNQVYTVRYAAVNAMLLNEFKKQHARIESQAAKIAEQQGEISALKTRQDQAEAQYRNEIGAMMARLQALEKLIDRKQGS